jgi:nitric oxide reductase NorD protein
VAEAEDVLVDAARHATVFIRDLWRRQHAPSPAAAPVALDAVAPRLDLLVTLAGGASLPLRVALPPPRPTLLHRVLHGDAHPRHRRALPATDGIAIWLPADLGTNDTTLALPLYRAMVLQQAQRAWRGTAPRLLDEREPWLRDAALVLEALAAEAQVARSLPGLLPALALLRRTALAQRPPLEAFTPARRMLERWLRRQLEHGPTAADDLPPDPAASVQQARRLLHAWSLDPVAMRRAGDLPLLRDWWTGELRPEDADGPWLELPCPAPGPDEAPVRAAHLSRRPDPRREAAEGEDESREPGAFMLQPDVPHERAEDPFGLQRPVDRDETRPAEELGEMLSELASARSQATPERAREVLLSDDPPPARAHGVAAPADPNGEIRFRYPEWDHALAAYREHGATVRVRPAPAGPQAWVDTTLARHGAQLDGIRRQFEALRPERLRLRRQVDGEELDLDACVEARADRRAGGALREAFYESRRRGRRSVAVSLLVDASGSTDGWVGAGRRVIDVEREALLLVSTALQAVDVPFAIGAFSGEGPHGVSVWPLKAFAEPCRDEVALRIAALEPQRFTRTGAAIRHASAGLMRQPTAHRLLVLLSDGKPNDVDQYDGRYGVEDLRQAVTEARLQGIVPFCLTVDRQAPGYLPKIFGATGYALLVQPERLPTALLEWTRRLLTH